MGSSHPGVAHGANQKVQREIPEDAPIVRLTALCKAVKEQ